MHLKKMYLQLVLLLILSSSVATTIVPLGSTAKMLNGAAPTRKLDESLEVFYFSQKLDHFSYTPSSYATFQQRYVVDSQHWGGPKTNAPILAYLGQESALYVPSSDFLLDNSPRLKAMVVYIEHRYYGESMPFGSAQEALKNATTLGYLNAAQALADYAAILLHIKEAYGTGHSPIIVIGGSYGGMLAAWFRLKYPHIALGALASSAPLLYFEDTLPKHGYFYIVTKVVKETSKECYNTIRKSWKEIDRIAARPNGLDILSKKFRTCLPLNKSSDIKDFLIDNYANTVQYNSGPDYLVTKMCKAINANPPNRKIDILDRIFAGVVASAEVDQPCYDTSSHAPQENNLIAWEWQSCTEIVIPIGFDKHDSMFPTKPFNMTSFTNQCKSNHGVSSQPHWITINFGIPDIKLILRWFGSNIIFSNGLSDPFSVGGVLEDISPTVVALTTRNGSHCLDIAMKSQDDPEWLVLQREKEIEIIESWISTYNRDLRNLNISN